MENTVHADLFFIRLVLMENSVMLAYLSVRADGK